MKESTTGTIKTSRNPRARISPRRTMEESITDSMERRRSPVRFCCGYRQKHIPYHGGRLASDRSGNLAFGSRLPGPRDDSGFAMGLGAAMLVGVAELAAGCFTAYVSYRMFAYGESMSRGD